METLIREFYQILQDYRIDEENYGGMTPERIHKWILQFDEVDRVFILEELKLIFEERYFSKNKVVSFLKGIIRTFTNDLGYASEADFLDNTHFLNLQRKGKSQDKLIELLFIQLKNDYQYDIEYVGSKSKKHYIYIDDVLCTGNTFFNNIKLWLDTRQETDTILKKLQVGEITLNIAYIFIAKKSYDRKLKQLYHIDDKLSEILKPQALFWIDKEILQPIVANQPDIVSAYEAKVIRQADAYAEGRYSYYPNFYRNSNEMNAESYSSYENRVKLENILLKKGIEILNNVNEIAKPNIRPLGFSLPSYKDFGFGALAFTWRNVPNNTPLVFWYSNGGFMPLFENVR
jgi:hypothetical protein